MDLLRTYLLDPITNTLKNHKLKILFLLMMTLAFYVVFFPYYQLTGIIESQISKSSRGQTQVSFSNLSLSLLPFGVSAEKISVFTPQMPSPLFIDKAYIRPSIADLLRFKHGGVLVANGVLGGDLNFKFSNLGQDISKNKNSQMVSIDADFSDLNLNNLAEWFKAPFQTAGKLSGDLDFKIDKTAIEQPQGTFQFSGRNVVLPDSVKLQGMELLLPEGQFKSLNISGRMANGQVTLKESTLGAPSDVIYGKTKGSLGISVTSMGGRLVPRTTSYDISLDLNFNKVMEKEIGSLFTTFLPNGNRLKSATVDGGARYLMSIKGYPGQNPNIEPLSTF